MKKEILEKLNRMFDDSGRDGCYYGDTAYDSLPVVFGYNLAIAEVIEHIESIPDPAPLDPHTCDLCVGDVVLFYNKELVVQRIEGEKIYAASSISVHEYSRDEITLKSNQRAGVQIETE